MTAPSCIQGNGPHGIDPFGNPIEFHSKSIPEGNGPSDILQIANIYAVFLNGDWRCGEMDKKSPQHIADTQDIEGMRFLKAKKRRRIITYNVIKSGGRFRKGKNT
jgi:hypothetical protein